MSKTFVTGLFKTRAAAEAAVDAIIKRGYTRDDISVFRILRGTRNSPFKLVRTPPTAWEWEEQSAGQLEQCSLLSPRLVHQ